MRRWISFLVVASLWIVTPGSGAFAQEAEPAPPPTSEVPEASSLDELLKKVQQGWGAERKENRAREERFKQSKAEQAKLLEQAKATLEREDARSEVLELTFQENETTLAELEETLAERLGTLGELFGVVRQVAGDAGGNIESSLVSAQLPDRVEFLQTLGQTKSLPSIESLERLWYELQLEMTEQGKVVRFDAPVLTVGGGEETKQVAPAPSAPSLAGSTCCGSRPCRSCVSSIASRPARRSPRCRASSPPPVAWRPWRWTRLAALCCRFSSTPVACPSACPMAATSATRSSPSA
jgi:biopolymer transport protein ExbB